MFVNSGGGGTSHQIVKSLRFRSGASAFLSRTPAGAGNRRTWTWSGWVKRGLINHSANLDLFSAAGTSFDNAIQFTGGGTNDILRLQLDGNNAGVVQSSAFYRDPSAHCHIVVSVDTTQATAANRVRIYVNGTEVAYGTSTYPTQNYDTMFNSANAHNIGRSAVTSSLHFDGYLSEINFIDGQALTPASFGEFSVETGQWVPKKYTGTYGTNGFYLPFNDGTNLTALTSDRSGNGNNWTASGISLTAGSTYDWMDDTPTNNFAVLSPVNAGTASTIFNAGLSFSGVANTNQGYVASTIGADAGQYYFELLGGTYSGIAEIGVSVGGAFTAGYRSDGTKDTDGVNSAYGATWTASDTVGCAWNATAKTVEFFKNNISQGAFSYAASGAAFPTFWSRGTASHNGHINFGQRPFAYTPPAGFKGLCTKNLPLPVIQNPKKHFDVSTRSGNGVSPRVVTGVGFQPDLVWIKTRNTSNYNVLFDSVRGTNKQLTSNATDAELTASVYGYVSAFSADGYSLTVGSTSDINTNNPANTYVDWLWKAGGAAVANTAGSITSQVSANTTAGFSIVTYTGTGANATVGHGLGVAPKMIIWKNKLSGTTWVTFHSSISPTNFLQLNTTDANLSSTTWLPFGSTPTAPTSLVFTVGNNVNTNNSGVSIVAYCFAEVPGFSRISSYVGNGSSDGPFVWCGFRPRYVMIKRTDATGNWRIVDTARSTYNANGLDLYPNLSNAEGAVAFDFLSNGFKPRVTDPDYNANGASYIFMAFAEAPFNYANAR